MVTAAEHHGYVLVGKKLEALEVRDLLHIVDSVMGEDELIALVKRSRHSQIHLGIKCHDCEGLAGRLGIK